MAELTRRQLIQGTALGAGAIGVLLSIPAIGFLLSPLWERKRISWVAVGSPGEVDSVKPGEPVPFTVRMPIGTGLPTEPVPRVVYVVRRDDGTLLTLSNVCSHMQCDVHWDRGLQQFLCPCHGGLYDAEGVNVGGPPPSPLPRWISRRSVSADGRTVLEVSNQFDESI